MTPVMTLSAPFRRPAWPSSDSRSASFFSNRSAPIATSRSSSRRFSRLQPFTEPRQHILDHGSEREARLPAPVLARGAVVQGPRPAFRDRLADGVDPVFDDEIRDVLANGLGQLDQI